MAFTDLAPYVDFEFSVILSPPSYEQPTRAQLADVFDRALAAVRAATPEMGSKLYWVGAVATTVGDAPAEGGRLLRARRTASGEITALAQAALAAAIAAAMANMRTNGMVDILQNPDRVPADARWMGPLARLGSLPLAAGALIGAAGTAIAAYARTRMAKRGVSSRRSKR